MLHRFYDSIKNVRIEPHAEHGTLIRERTKIRKNYKVKRRKPRQKLTASSINTPPRRLTNRQ